VEQLRALVPRVLVTVQSYANTHSVAGRPLVSGFSQGGMLCYELAARAPSMFAAVFPVSGMMLDPVVETAAKDLPPLHAFHGSVDPVISYESDAVTVTSLQRMGATAELTRIEGAPHWITDDMRRGLFDALALAARAQLAQAHAP
jgi:phospholipase/carboxylesterase